MAIAVLLADDSTETDHRLEDVLRGTRSIEVVSAVGTYVEAVRQCRDLQPDVAIVSLSTPELGNTEVIIEIQRHCPKVRSLAISSRVDREEIGRVLDAGACGYLTTKNASRMLTDTVKRIYAGATVLGPQAAAAITSQGLLSSI
ncbi:MAG: response regulator transcription factor [Lentisphaerae bacterium]|jgi:DNA-binding NarL/FixJ family response regulator|nr:response regulator transcription factor [Lentisphaerota bacterium]MBT5613226.1 response regulator transcription factor [Lentisphaerota bacterium]MBT7062111.1 response regulator transcription factor [Lentisphaerota bacterium]MBT7847623.1 response regulator transcription factor [Lentisphaerota bacterium]